MDNLALTLLLTVIGLCFIGSLTGAYFYGFSRGAKWEPFDPTPTGYAAGEEASDITIELTGYLEPTTGPITLSPITQSIEVVAVRAEDVQGAADHIAALTAKLARAERLRKRYLRLLKEERAMMLSYFGPGNLILSPYWKRWLHNHASMIDEMLMAGAWGSSGIANTR